MRIIPLGLLVFISSLLVIGCNKKDKIDPVLGAGKTDLAFTAEGGKQSVEISSNTEWELTDLPGWLQANPSKGKGNTTVEFTIAENTSGKEQKAVITLKSASLPPVRISVKQEQAELVITGFTQHAKGGEDLVINGSGFSQVKEENIVTVNGKPATVKQAGKTSLTVTVPAKAGDGRIEVKVNTKSIITEGDFYYDWIGVVTTAYDGNAAGNIPIAPQDIVTDGAGVFYIADHYVVYKWIPPQAPEIFAGYYAGFRDGHKQDASFKIIRGISINAAGNLFVADYDNNAIRMITPAGTVTTVAGTGERSSNNGSTNVATFAGPYGIAATANGTIYVSEEYSQKIRKISEGQVSTLAGSGVFGSKDGPGNEATFSYPKGLGLDSDGNLLLADQYSHKLRKITPAGEVSTFAGSGQALLLDGLKGTASFRYLSGVTSDSEGNIIVVDRDNNAVRRISKAGWVCTLAGKGQGQYGSQNGTGSQASFYLPENAAVDKDGQIFVADINNKLIRKIIIQ